MKFLITVVLLLLMGCSAQTLATLKADVHTIATATAGAAHTVETFSANNPDAIAELGAVAKNLASQAGVSPAEQATLSQVITPQNAVAVAGQVKAVAANIAFRTTPSATSP